MTTQPQYHFVDYAWALMLHNRPWPNNSKSVVDPSLAQDPLPTQVKFGGSCPRVSTYDPNSNKNDSNSTSEGNQIHRMSFEWGNQFFESFFI